MKPKIIAIVQARLQSTRLPGKVLMPLGSKMNSCLRHIVERVRMTKSVDDIIVATTTNHKDLPIVNFCRYQLKCLSYRHTPGDVLSRVVNAANIYSKKEVIIVDITGDCPLIDPEHIDYLINLFFKHKLDYVSNIFPSSFPDGFDVQIYSEFILKQIDKIVPEWPHKHRKHTGWNIVHYQDSIPLFYGIMNNIPRKIKIMNCTAPSDQYFPNWNLSLDTEDDLKLLDIIFKHFDNNKFSAKQVIEFLKLNPELLKINENKIRKVAGEG